MLFLLLYCLPIDCDILHLHHWATSPWRPVFMALCVARKLPWCRMPTQSKVNRIDIGLLSLHKIVCSLPRTHEQEVHVINIHMHAGETIAISLWSNHNNRPSTGGRCWAAVPLLLAWQTIRPTIPENVLINFDSIMEDINFERWTHTHTENRGKESSKKEFFFYYEKLQEKIDEMVRLPFGNSHKDNNSRFSHFASQFSFRFFFLLFHSIRVFDPRHLTVSRFFECADSVDIRYQWLATAITKILPFFSCRVFCRVAARTIRLLLLLLCFVCVRASVKASSYCIISVITLSLGRNTDNAQELWNK